MVVVGAVVCRERARELREEIDDMPVTTRDKSRDILLKFKCEVHSTSSTSDDDASVAFNRSTMATTINHDVSKPPRMMTMMFQEA